MIADWKGCRSRRTGTSVTEAVRSQSAERSLSFCRLRIEHRKRSSKCFGVSRGMRKKSKKSCQSFPQALSTVNLLQTSTSSHQNCVDESVRKNVHCQYLYRQVLSALSPTFSIFGVAAFKPASLHTQRTPASTTNCPTKVLTQKGAGREKDWRITNPCPEFQPLDQSQSPVPISSQQPRNLESIT